MGKYQEVEAKYKLYNASVIWEKLNALNAEHTLIDEIQIDTYYSPCHRDFLEPDIVSEWLRVRKTKNGSSLNFKQFLPIGAAIQNSCNEYETQISDAFALQCILRELNFREIAVVKKRGIPGFMMALKFQLTLWRNWVILLNWKS